MSFLNELQLESQPYLLSVEQHAVDSLDGVGGSLLRLEVDEAVALGVSVGGILKTYNDHKYK